MAKHDPYRYLFVRKDLSLQQQIIQASHAVDEMAKVDVQSSNTNFITLIGVDDETALHEISSHLDSHGILYHKFYEPDVQQHTAIATSPLIGKQRKPLFGYKCM